MEHYDTIIAKPVGDLPIDPRRHIAVIGPSGTGKTTWGAASPETLILLSEKQAQGRIAESNPGARVIPIGTMAELRDVARWLTKTVFPGGVARKEGWVPKFIVMDSVTDMSRYLNDEIQETADKKTGGGSAGDLGFRGWKLYGDGVMRMVRSFRDLPVTLIALFLEDTTSPQDDQPGTRRAQLNMKSLSSKIMSLFDLVFWAGIVKVQGEDVYALRTIGGDWLGYRLEHGKGHPALTTLLRQSDFPPAKVLQSVVTWKRPEPEPAAEVKTETASKAPETPVTAPAASGTPKAPENAQKGQDRPETKPAGEEVTYRAPGYAGKAKTAAPKATKESK